MLFLIELCIYIFGSIILEPIIIFIIEKIRKKKYAIKPIEIHSNNFTIQQNKDMKGIVLILGIFMGVSTLLPLIILPCTYKSNNMGKLDIIIAMSIFSILLLIIIFIMFYIFSFKVEVRNDKLYVYSLFKLKIFNIESLTTRELLKGNYKFFLVFHEDKFVTKISHSMTNYELAKEKLKVEDV